MSDRVKDRVSDRSPAPRPSPSVDNRPAPQTERQDLARHADDAKLALRAALADAAHHARQSAQHAGKAALASADPHRLTAGRPWVAVAGAAAAGLVGGLALVPSRQKQVARRLATIERLVAAEQQVAGRPVATTGRAGWLKKGWVNQGLRLGLNYARPAIISAITGAIAAKQAAPDPAEETADDGAADAGSGRE